jgi:hypothetical protein
MTAYTYPSSPRDEAVCDLFTTAVEGGINYWADVRQYQWSDRTPEQRQIKEFRAVVVDREDGREYVIDFAAIVRGAELADTYFRDSGVRSYHGRALRDFVQGNFDLFDYDAETADIVVQFGVLGELVYG